MASYKKKHTHLEVMKKIELNQNILNGINNNNNNNDFDVDVFLAKTEVSKL